MQLYTLILAWVSFTGSAIAHPSSAGTIETLALDIADEAFGTLHKRDISCFSCQTLLTALKKLPRHRALELAQSYRARHHRQFDLSEAVPFNFAADFFNALSLADPLGDDGRYMCHYLMGKACSLPATPHVDFEALLPPKVNASLPASRGDSFKVVHLSDVHLELNYTVGSPANCIGALCCRSDSLKDPLAPFEPAGKFGAYKCDAPESLLHSTLQDVSTSGNEFAFALFTGDMVDHDPLFMSKSLCIAEEETTMTTLKAWLQDVPVYAVLGNHDSYPFSQDAPHWTGFSEKFSYNTELMSQLWGSSGWVENEQLEQIKKHHGAYSVEARPGLKVITLNTNFWYIWNFYNYIRTDSPDPSGMLSFLIDELAECEATGKRAWITGHVPPGGLVDEVIPLRSEFFNAILERFQETVAAVFFGHTHRDEFTVGYANNATAKCEDDAFVTAYMAPSVTPYVDLNPGWRYYDVDADTFEILDVKTYYASIANYQTGNLDWKLGYSAREIYGKHRSVQWPEDKPLTAKFWHRVSQSILHDPDMAQLYQEMAMRKSPYVKECDAACRRKQFCYTSSMTAPQAIECNAQEAPKNRRWSFGLSGLGSNHFNLPIGRAGRPMQKIL